MVVNPSITTLFGKIEVFLVQDIARKIKAVVVGHAVADALGVPVEFCSRDELTQSPVETMEGYGTYDVPAGAWSDDTSMSLAALDAMTSGTLDFTAIMENFVRWYRHAAYTPTGVVFDIGGTCGAAIHNYITHHRPPSDCGLSDTRSNGNGSLMRIHPFSLLAFYDPYIRTNFEEVIDRASSLTHAHERSKLACRIYTFVLFELLKNPDISSVKKGLQAAAVRYFDTPEYGCYERLFDEDFDKLPIQEIKSSGYVVDTLEAAIWCLLTTDSYAACVLRAVNLGEDTDTVAAVAGGLAGALYGYDAIPSQWLDTLIAKDAIEAMCEMAAEAWTSEVVPCVTSPYPVVDVHMHVLPGLDDGARDIEESIAMLKMAISQGVTDVFCSSHSLMEKDYALIYDEAYQKLLSAKEAEGLDITLHPSCEVLCDLSCIYDIVNALRDGIFHTMGESRYVLTEFYPDVKPGEALQMLDILSSHGYRPIVAHMERNVYITPRMVEIMVKNGVLIQVNAFSFWSESKPQIRQRAWELLEQKLVHMIGSDAHRLTHRPPKMDTGIRYILEHTHETYAKEILGGNALELLCGGLI